MPPATLPAGGLPLEIVPEGDAAGLDPALQPLPDPVSSDEDEPANEIRTRRRGLGALLRLRANEPADRARPRDVPGDAIDPVADDALQRRLERQIREVGGRRLSSLSVRVSGDTVRIRARADRFWNRRGLRRAIEGLPALAGYDADITVD
jgi:hypothetical protein